MLHLWNQIYEFMLTHRVVCTGALGNIRYWHIERIPTERNRTTW